ncbi:MAG: polysaccharide biosynthesis tyrosine autokinase [Prevotella sp.]|nr:polysaccharide biosynthesis tyrosine autokinase [Prevotella sp.]
MDNAVKNTEEIKDLEAMIAEDERSSFDLLTVYTLIVLNWKWFLASIIIFVSAALLYVRYTDPVYSVAAKVLVKEESNNNSSRNSLRYVQDLGTLSASTGIDNEVVILQSKLLAYDAVKNLKLYTEYRTEGKVKKSLMYKTQPITADLDSAHLADNTRPVEIKIVRKNGVYFVEGTSEHLRGKFTRLPAVVKTSGGIITLRKNGLREMDDNQVLHIKISPIKAVANRYARSLSVSNFSKQTSIAALQLRDMNAERGLDYLKELVMCYNQQANEDKNEVAFKTEAFINSRLEKINAELGATEGEIENYKRENRMVQQTLNSSYSMQQAYGLEQKLTDAQTQMQLVEYLREYVLDPKNRYKIIPSNIGLTDPISASFISNYNQTVQERNRMLLTASENSPQVKQLTATLDQLEGSIHEALTQARRSAQIQQSSLQQQYNVYQQRVAQSPEQERVLNQIGRQQEVKSGLYLMLLQKREENSISLAATADKGRLIDEPTFEGKVSPKSSIIMLVALVLGFGLPLLISYLLQIMRYKIEGHEDVMRHTRLPIVADVAVASESVKSAAGIVVHENKNNQIDEIFRSMRTNIQFMMQENQKVIMFTSTTSGEGKTFNAANLAVSFALLGKKVVLMGLDIRKPALGRLFEIADRQAGITTLLTKDHVTMHDVESQLRPSGVNANLDLLLAGPVPPNPTELLARDSMRQIMELLRQRYDYVIVDTAPVGLVTDTLQIGKYVDVTCVVVRSDYTPKATFGMINSLAQESKLPNMCVVLNGVDMSKKKYGYYYGYGRYGKYGRYGYGRYGYGRYGYGRYGYGSYGNYGTYGQYGNYSASHYGKKDDDSIKRK